MAVTRQSIKGFHANNAPAGAAQRELPAGFLQFFTPFQQEFAARHRALVSARRAALEQSLRGNKPNHLPASPATREDWRIEVPAWCADQRNQMTGPADDAELVVKMLNSGAPGVMLDLEDSTVNEWEHQRLGVENILQALRGSLTYHDAKRNSDVGIKPSNTVIWIRARGLHLHQGGLMERELCSASLFDVARIVFAVEPADLKHPLAFYIPKSESAEEALFWRDVFQSLAQARGWPKNYIKCMALVESHPLAYQMEEFLYKPAAAGNLSPARRAGDRRHDRSLSKPPGSGVERTRFGCAAKRQEERSRFADGWRLDRASRSESDSA